MTLTKTLQVITVALCFASMVEAETANLAPRLQEAVAMLKHGDYSQAADSYIALVQELESLPIPDKRLVTALSNLAVAEFRLGKFRESERYYLRSLEVMKQYPDVAEVERPIVLNNLSMVYKQTRRYSEAVALYEQLFQFQEKKLDTLVTTLNNAAALYLKLERLDDAERLLQRALNTCGTQVSEDAAAIHNNLAQVYKLKDRPLEADPHYRKAIEMWEAKLGPSHPDLAKGLLNLADLYRTQGKLAGSAKLLERAVAILDNALGSGHAEAIDARNRLAHVYLAQGRSTEASRVQRSGFSNSVLQSNAH